MTSEVTMGHRWTCGIGLEAEAGTAVDPTVWLQIASESLTNEVEHVDAEGLHGSRSHNRQRVTTGKKDPKGGIVINGLRPEIADLLLKAATGDTSPADGVYALQNTLPTLTIVVWRPPKRFTYAGCKCNVFTLESAADAQALKATLEVLAMTEALSASEPEDSYTQTQRILCHKDLTISAHSQTLKPSSLRLSIRNNLDEDTFRNSATRLEPAAGDRVVDGEVVIDWGAVGATLYTAFEAGTQAALSAAWADGLGNSLTAAGSYCDFRGTTPNADGRGAVTPTYPFQMLSSAAGADDELAITLAEAS